MENTAFYEIRENSKTLTLLQFRTIVRYRQLLEERIEDIKACEKLEKIGSTSIS